MLFKVVELDLSRPIAPIEELQRYDGLAILVRYRNRTVGWAHLNTDRRASITEDHLRRAIAQQLSWEMAHHVLGQQFFPATPTLNLPPISVVVPFCKNSSRMKVCLESLLRQDYPSYEIVIVDTSRGASIGARLKDEIPVRYVREEGAGLSRARNRGIREARNDVIAFTTEDAWMDGQWLRAIGRAFDESEVQAVAGLVLSPVSDRPAHSYFELQHGQTDPWFRRRTLRWQELRPRDLLLAVDCVLGANMALRRGALAEVGHFDEMLDAARLRGEHGDVELMHRLVARGKTLVYDPAALVWCRRHFTKLSTPGKACLNSLSFGAYLLACVNNRTLSVAGLLEFALLRWLARKLVWRLVRPRGTPRRLIAAELVGALASPAFYLMARLTARPGSRSHDEPGALAEPIREVG